MYSVKLLNNTEGYTAAVRLMIDINKDSTIEELKIKIIDQLGLFSIIDTYRDLTQLYVFNLQKVSKNKRKALPENGPIEEELNDGDIIEFEITSQDIWIKVFMTLIDSSKIHKTTFEIRANRDMNIKDFKAYIAKSVITIWNQLKIYNLKDITFYFVDSIKIVKYLIFSKRNGAHRSDIYNAQSSDGLESDDLNDIESVDSRTIRSEITGNTLNFINTKNEIIDEVILQDNFKVGDYFSLRNQDKYLLVETKFSTFEEVKSKNYSQNRSVIAMSERFATLRETAKFDYSLHSKQNYGSKL